MKLIYDYHIFSAQKYGGISRYFFEIISRAAADPSFNVSLFQGFFINRYGLEKFRSQLQNYFGVARTELTVLNPIFKQANRIGFKMFFDRVKPELYHQTHYSELNPTYHGKRALTVLDMIHELFPQYFPTGDITREQKKKAVSQAQRVFCISEATKRDLIQVLKVPEEKITVTHLANSLHHTPSTERTHDAPYVLIVGDRKGYKNFKVVLQAFSASNRLKKVFHLVCAGGPPLSEEEQKIISDYGLNQNVFWFPAGDQELANFYHHAAVFIYPSLYEGFGLPVLEAMHYRCPVIATNQGSVPELVGNAGLMFQPQQVDELVSHLEKVLFDQEYAEKFRDLGVEQEKRFSWDRCFQQTKAGYLNG